MHKNSPFFPFWLYILPLLLFQLTFIHPSIHSSIHPFTHPSIKHQPIKHIHLASILPPNKKKAPGARSTPSTVVERAHARATAGLVPGEGSGDNLDKRGGEGGGSNIYAGKTSSRLEAGADASFGVGGEGDGYDLYSYDVGGGSDDEGWMAAGKEAG
ncbi:unnamed protein product, partial [Discosporangium mesarthrocarpum]